MWLAAGITSVFYIEQYFENNVDHISKQSIKKYYWIIFCHSYKNRFIKTWNKAETRENKHGGGSRRHGYVYSALMQIGSSRLLKNRNILQYRRQLLWHEKDIWDGGRKSGLAKCNYVGYLQRLQPRPAISNKWGKKCQVPLSGCVIRNNLLAGRTKQKQDQDF